ncbi:phage holin family protein [Massilia cavernae]|uniref:Phage holin family protein n=1 Tax=Massilia cavernae TaxID=2320864 RepID=A0A418Y4C1_9BURK|nr:phage holin family protein [Massilia cavernae]RJG20483.1 phage holin family protein [Massilia cavernae]
MDHTSTTVHGPGLLGGLTSLAKNVFGLIVARLELAALEMTEVRDHLLELVAIFALAVICSWFAIAYGTAMIVALSWEALGWKILLILFLVFIGITAALVFKARAMLKEGKLAFPETMNELRNDRDMLL